MHPAAPPVPVVQMAGVRKVFGPVVALDGADFTLGPREIHGLLGGNGAGKTTLMNVLYGLYRADAGRIHLQGRPAEIRGPADAIRHRIGMVHQHFLQVGSFTVAENVVLAAPLGRRYRLDLRSEQTRISELAERFGLAVDPQARMEALPMGIRQRVEIVKALYRGARVLILDEPTTNLTPQEVDALFRSLRVMVDEGLSVVFITHKIREVLAVCDRISVMRDGRTVLTQPRAEAAEEGLVRAMVGGQLDMRRSVLFTGRDAEGAPPPSGEPVLRLDGLRTDGGAVEVRRGEILGVAGVAGNGQTELAESLIGLRAEGARITVNGAPLAGGPAGAMARGVTYIPEDRLDEGFLPTSSVAENLILGFHRRPEYSRGALFNRRAVLEVARGLIREYNIRTPGPEEAAANLSGGNIQRLMLARAFAHPSALLVAHNPTRGLDIPSTEFVYEKLLALRASGGAVVLLSDDLDELLLLSDRIAVLYRGRVVGMREREAADRYELGRMMSGVA